MAEEVKYIWHYRQQLSFVTIYRHSVTIMRL